ncbi:putative hexosyltransferase [Kineosporia succinea]|uniref:DUF2029 domain-containing protein n=1 Tax=Kineosporia succinea TaxID=84632 RepID=A0ABT9PCG0_9ACTN|nr:hypothetical protein [Kineosporia succinea]MDP9829860.1 hypothetical protein [Kineosporia succinea]
MSFARVQAVRRNTFAGGGALLAVAFVLLVLPAALGPSSATPPLGPRGSWPAWDLGLNPPDGLVIVALAGGYLLAAAGLWLGLRSGRAPTPKRVAQLSVLMTVLFVLVAPFGSADHLSYVAYGRIKALGGDPYLVPPDAWPGADAVIGSVEAPWEGTTSVYGPVATAVFDLVARLGGGDLRLTVWLWQLVVGAAFLLTGWLLYRLAPPELKSRVSLLWLLNPALAAVLVGGAHLDTLAAAGGVAGAALLILGRGPVVWVLAGAAFAVGAGTKMPYLAMAAAAWWAIRSRPVREVALVTGSAVVGGLLVLVPGHLWSGPHTYDQTQAASHYVSIASPWRSVVSLLEALIGSTARDLLPFLFAALALVIVAAASRLFRSAPVNESQSFGRALLVLSLAYPLAAPYVLPWYDAPLWVALVLADVPVVLLGLLVTRLAGLAISYVPGRADVPGSLPLDVMLGVRHVAGPLLVLGVLAWLFRASRRASAQRTSTNASATTVTPRTTMAALPMKPGVPQSHDH